MPTPLQRIRDPLWDDRDIRLWIKRDDLAHPVVSGNKIRKLAFLIPLLNNGEYPGILSFGGPHSNHLHALAWLCHHFQIPFTAWVRSTGTMPTSPMLTDMLRWGADIVPVSPARYRKKDEVDWIRRWESEYPGYQIIPEGGRHQEALRGIGDMIEEVLAELPDPDIWMCPVGTGTTFAGMVRHKPPAQWAIGISALKSSVLDEEIGSHWDLGSYSRWILAQQWHFGGYGKVPDRLRFFLESFRDRHGILLDPLYNGKAMYAYYQYVKCGLIPTGSTVIFIHTGGLQGWRSLIVNC